MKLKSSERNKKTAQQLLQEFMQDCEIKGMTNESIRRYRSCIGIFLDFVNEKKLNLLSISREALKEFISFCRKKGNSYKTIKNNFSAVSSFYEYLTYEGYIASNPILPVRKRYLKTYKETSNNFERKCPTVEDMANFIISIPNTRDKAIAILFAKTGIRRNELIRIDINDVNWENQSIILKPTPKRSNRVVFFDDECMRALRRWLEIRETLPVETKALFVGEKGERLDRQGIYAVIAKWAKRAGLHNPKGLREEHFSPHCFRHWFTTHLLRGGMPREYVKELRGDARKDAIDIYNHIDKEELRKSYLACIPVLGV